MAGVLRFRAGHAAGSSAAVGFAAAMFVVPVALLPLYESLARRAAAPVHASSA